MRLFSVLLLFFLIRVASAQEIANFTQFFVNPYVINPSFAGIEGTSGLYLTYRMQWVDFDGAPRVGNASYHTGIGRKVGFGLNLTNDRRGLLNTSSGLMTFSYGAQLGDNAFLRFGASVGAASNGIDRASATNPTDPALSRALENNVFILGNAGLSLHLGSFHIGASLPDLFEPQLVDSITSDNFSFSTLRPTERYIVTASNRFYFGNDKHVFEPYFVYRIHKSLPTQWEAAAVVHLNHAFWFGGSYKQDFGVSGAVGFKMPENFGIGYSYTFANVGSNQIQSPTHEVTFSLLLGKKKPGRQKYSFVNTLIEKEPVVTRAPTGQSPQTFCAIDEPTLSDLKVTGASIKWYETENSRTALSSSEALVNGTTYYATQTANQMESRERLAVTIELNNPSAPRANQSQSFNSADNPRISDLNSAAENTVWYSEASGGTAHNEDLPLIAKTYYAAQVVDGCESTERTPVEVTIETPIVLDTTTTIPVDTVPKTIPVDTIPKTNTNLQQQQSTDSTVVVQKGDHMLELQSGTYVIVGVFSNYDNAESFSDRVFLMGYQDCRFGYLSDRGYWYVYLNKIDDGVVARKWRDQVRERTRFRDAWVLEVRD